MSPTSLNFPSHWRMSQSSNFLEKLKKNILFLKTHCLLMYWSSANVSWSLSPGLLYDNLQGKTGKYCLTFLLAHSQFFLSSQGLVSLKAYVSYWVDVQGSWESEWFWIQYSEGLMSQEGDIPKPTLQGLWTVTFGIHVVGTKKKTTSTILECEIEEMKNDILSSMFFTYINLFCLIWVLSLCFPFSPLSPSPKFRLCMWYCA